MPGSGSVFFMRIRPNQCWSRTPELWQRWSWPAECWTRSSPWRTSSPLTQSSSTPSSGLGKASSLLNLQFCLKSRLPDQVLSSLLCQNSCASSHSYRWNVWIIFHLAHLLATAVLWDRIQTSLKNTKWAPKKYAKKFFHKKKYFFVIKYLYKVWENNKFFTVSTKFWCFNNKKENRLITSLKIKLCSILRSF